MVVSFVDFADEGRAVLRHASVEPAGRSSSGLGRSADAALKLQAAPVVVGVRSKRVSKHTVGRFSVRRVLTFCSSFSARPP